MRSVPIDLPEGDMVVVGGLYTDEDRQLLGEDMIDVFLPAGYLVEAGWYPEGSATGRYKVAVTKGLECLVTEYTDDPKDAARKVAHWTRFYLRG